MMFRARYAYTLVVVPHILGSICEAIFGDFWRFCSILGDFSVGTLLKTHLVSRFLGWYDKTSEAVNFMIFINFIY
jgi:hypothetical protein